MRDKLTTDQRKYYTDMKYYADKVDEIQLDIIKTDSADNEFVDILMRAKDNLIKACETAAVRSRRRATTQEATKLAEKAMSKSKKTTKRNEAEGTKYNGHKAKAITTHRNANCKANHKPKPLESEHGT